jgi:periplasmic protein TonB
VSGGAGIRPAIGPGDRLGATLAFSLIAHGVLALGVGFSIDDPAPVVPTLDIILTRTRSEEAPKQADFLAQSSQQGGGEAETPDRPREPQPAPVPKPERGLAPVPVEASAPRPEPVSRTPVLTRSAPAEQRADNRDQRETPAVPLPSSRQMIERSLEMARLAAELERQTQAYAKRPKRKFVSASTQEYEFASYLRGWVARVERIGNLNYPDEARRRNLQGQLVLTVAVRRDGTVESIDVVQPSGHRLLDEAAVRTVRLAEPFGPLPQTKETVDVLHITRTWQYLPGGVMRNQ